MAGFLGFVVVTTVLLSPAYDLIFSTLTGFCLNIDCLGMKQFSQFPTKNMLNCYSRNKRAFIWAIVESFIFYLMLLKAVLLLLYFPSKIIETIIFFIIGKKIPIIVDMNSIFVTKELGSGFELDDAFLPQLLSLIHI